MTGSSEALLTPHLLAITDLAREAASGADVTERVRLAVATALNDLQHVYGARFLADTFIRALKEQARHWGTGRLAYAMTLLLAAEYAEHDATAS